MKRPSRSTDSGTRWLWAATIIGISILLGACGGGSQAKIRPLIDVKDTPLTLAKYDDDSLQARLEQLHVEVAPYAQRVQGWGKLTTDLLNPEIMSIVFIGANRSTINFGYGTYATSMLSRDEQVIFVMAGDTGSCWGIRFSGSLQTPTIKYINMFAPECSASLYVDSVESAWMSTWPPTAIPPTEG